MVEVVAGTVPYSVRLATTRAPAGEDEALLQPGETVVLHSGDVDPGETIDGRLEYLAQDGSGATSVDELDDFTFTRPTVGDCERATATPSSPPATPSPDAAPSEPTPTPTPTSPLPAPASPAPSDRPASPSPTTPDPAAPASTPPATTAPGTAAPTPSPSPSPPPSAAQAGGTPAAVPAGGVVRVRVEGYEPGERVTIALRDSGEVLAAATADDGGSVVAEVLIPAWTASGPASLDVVGTDSAAVADVPLEVAADASGAPDGAGSRVPLLVAAGALGVTGAGLWTMVARRRPGRG